MLESLKPTFYSCCGVCRLKSREAELVLTQQQVTEQRELVERLRGENAGMLKERLEEYQHLKDVSASSVLDGLEDVTTMWSEGVGHFV